MTTGAPIDRGQRAATPAGLYRMKPAWQRLLQPLTDRLIGRHVDADLLTAMALVAAALAGAKPGLLLVNYARGAVVDEGALLDALRAGVVAGAGLDVFSAEPADPASPLASHPRVVATPHCGVATADVVDAYADLLCANIVAAREGGELKHRCV